MRVVKPKPGDLVTPQSWLGDAFLWKLPGRRPDGNDIKTGTLRATSIGMVVKLHRLDATEVYVVGPDGMGWVAGGLLQYVE